MHLLTYGKNHVPKACLSIPEHLGVAEVRCLRDQNRISLVLGEALATVRAVSNRLRLTFTSRSIEGDDGIGSKACGILRVDNTRTAENGAQTISFERNGLVLPVHQIGAG